MSYDIAIIDHHPRFNNCKDFLAWYDDAIGHQQDDYRQARPALQQWFLKMKDRVRPLNGEFAPAADEIDAGEFPEADYSFGKDFIYVALAHTDAEKTSALAFELAKECRLTYFDISGTSELHNADGSHFQVLRQQSVYDVIEEESQKQHRWKVNKIIYPPLILIGGSLPIIVYALIVHSTDSLVALGIWMVSLLFVLWKSMDNFWIFRRLPIMSPRHYKTVKVSINSQEHTGDVFDVDSGISFRYNSKEKMFYMSKTMYTDPRRYPKEYEERKYQFQARIEQAHIPIAGWISPSESTISFGTSVRMMKRYATPENIHRIREVIIDVSKEDYNRQMFSKFTYGSDTLYLDTCHYQIVRALLVSTEGSAERYCPQDVSVEPSKRLADIFEQIKTEGRMYKLQQEDLIEEDEFERNWKKSA